MDKAGVLTLFLGVVRARSFARAAVEAEVTPQAVSRRRCARWRNTSGFGCSIAPRAS